MTQKALSRGSTVDQALSAIRKKPVVRIESSVALDESIVAYVRNAAVGMALSYLECVDIVVSPVLFSLRHLGTLFAAALHLIMPLSIAWFASHWTERMEAAVWTGPAIMQALSFLGLWLFAFVAWSALWLALHELGRKVKRALGGFVRTGESYLSPPSQARSARNGTR